MHRRGIAAFLLIAGLLAFVPTPPAGADKALDVRMLYTDREAVGAPYGYVGTGLRGGFRFFEPDFDATVHKAVVRVSSDSDPVGVPVWATRAHQNDAYYTGTFAFSTTASNATSATIKVADGDDVTMTYRDAEGDDGLPVTLTATAPWNAGSAYPDHREMSFADTNPNVPVVRGAWRAVAPGARVRVYPTQDAVSAIGASTAFADGSFTVVTTPFAVRPSGVWVSAVESGQAESKRVYVHWAAVTGRVVRPEDNGGQLNTFVYVLAPGCTDPSLDECWRGGGFTNHNGRFDAAPTLGGGQPSAGSFDLKIQQQANVNEASPGPWRSTAYGNPPFHRFTYDGGSTLDLGNRPMLAPNFKGRVRAGLVGVDDAMIWVTDHPSGDITLSTGGYSRHDGRFALYLKDGDYNVEVRPPPICGGYAVKSVRVSVRNGVATPPGADYDVGLDQGSYTPPIEVPVVGGGATPVGIDVNSPAGPVAVSLTGSSGSGDLSVGCGAVNEGPSIEIVAPPVELDSPGIAFATSDVCLGYDPEALAAQGVSVSEVQLYHFADSGAVEPITATRDTANRRICGRTTSFSSFALGVPASTATAAAKGYWMLEEGGTVHAFGAGNYGGTTEDVVDIEPTGSGKGYLILTAAGAVRARGDAKSLGGAGTLFSGERATSLSAVPSGGGYWVFTSFGRAIRFGTAGSFGDMTGTPLNGPVLDSVATPTGKGYYMVASDGGVFAFGDAKYRGSMGGAALNQPVQSLVPDGDGLGYWLVASDGGVFSFDAPFRGSMGGVPLNGPVTGMVRFGNGYLMVGTDGGIFNFSDRPFLGSLGGRPPPRPIVAVAATP